MFKQYDFNDDKTINPYIFLKTIAKRTNIFKKILGIFNIMTTPYKINVYANK